MLIGLVRSSSPDRLHENYGEYRVSKEPATSAAGPVHCIFDHERLEAYQSSLHFIAWTVELLERFPDLASHWTTLDRASTSVPLNIAEGNGKFTSPDRCRFFDNARSATLDCAACLDVLVAKKKTSNGNTEPGKQLLSRVNTMLVGLIRRNAPGRFQTRVSYRSNSERET